MRLERSALVAVACAFTLVAEAQGQGSMRVSVSPVFSVGSFPARAGGVSDVPGDGGVVADLDTGLGLQADLEWPEVPIRLRGGALRTVGGSLRAEAGSRSESCGLTCTRTEVFYESVGDASVTLGWMDLVVLTPFDGPVTPYGYLGAGYRRTSASTDRPDVTGSLPEPRSQAVLRYGAGLEVDGPGSTAVWVELSFADPDPLPGSTDPYGAGWTGGGQNHLLSVGVRVPLVK